MSQTFAQLINGKSATVEFSTGSASTPSVAFSGDTNTGIYSPGADQVAISTGGSGRLFVDASGNVGVGGSVGFGAIDHGIHVTGSGAQEGIRLQTSAGSSGILEVYAESGGATLDTRGSGYIRFNNTTTEWARFDSSGRLGIGTSSPSYILEVRQDSSGVPVGINMVDTNASGRSYSIRSDAGQLRFRDVTGSADRITLDSSGRLGIGTTSPGAALDVSGNIRLSAGNPNIEFNNGGAMVYGPAGNTLAFATGGGPSTPQERARIDSSGHLLVGTSSARVIEPYGLGTDGQFANTFEDVSDTDPGPGIALGSSSTTDRFGPYLYLFRSRGGSVGSNTSVSSGDNLGTISFAGADGTDVRTRGAAIYCEVDGTPGTNDMPGRLVFSTTADGASSPTERGRFTSTGYFKASNNGSYTTFGTDMHELRTTASQWTTSIRNVHASDPYGLYITYAASPNNTTNPFVHCATDTGGTFAQIRSNGGLANVQANNVNLSDERTKKDISPASDTWNCIKEWEIVNYRYRNQPDDADLNLGVIAQQVAESCPEVITVFQEAKEATEDQPAQEERLGVKEQQMYWMAIKALQEAQVRIESLEAINADLLARVTALESA